MTTFVHCRGCGQQIHETAPTCPKCGAPQYPGAPQSTVHRQPLTPGAGPEEVSAGWNKRFAQIEKAGGPKMPRAKDFPFGERCFLVFNIWGFLFGPFYYLVKGMWKKAISLFGLTLVIIIVASVVLGAMGMPTGILSFVGAALFGTRANVDFYKKVVLADNGWW